jgi:four helix bundle protein
MKRYDLEDRLIAFAVSCIEIVNHMDQNKAGLHLSDQLMRSGTSAALNYGEAQSGESRKDFIHKMKVVLKELRESQVCLKIISRARLFQPESKLDEMLKEASELVAIFVKSVYTAQIRQQTR